LFAANLSPVTVTRAVRWARKIMPDLATGDHPVVPLPRFGRDPRVITASGRC
jgi:hypothetical protein